MPVIYLTEEAQQTILESENQGKENHERIPLLLRNINTGWPLLQVTLFSASDNGKSNEYEHVLGGGKCHDFDIGAFNFAGLITKIPGPMTIRGGELLSVENSSLLRKQVNANYVAKFLSYFNVHHKAIPFQITSEHNAYGLVTNIVAPMGDPVNFGGILYERSFKFALKPTAKIYSSPIALGYEQLIMKETDIQQSVNEDVAIFVAGQIFIDLGAFLVREVKDAEMLASLREIFKVNQFLKIRHLMPDVTKFGLDAITPEQISQLEKEEADAIPTPVPQCLAAATAQSLIVTVAPNLLPHSVLNLDGSPIEKTPGYNGLIKSRLDWTNPSIGKTPENDWMTLNQLYWDAPLPQHSIYDFNDLLPQQLSNDNSPLLADFGSYHLPYLSERTSCVDVDQREESPPFAFSMISPQISIDDKNLLTEEPSNHSLSQSTLNCDGLLNNNDAKKEASLGSPTFEDSPKNTFELEEQIVMLHRKIAQLERENQRLRRDNMANNPLLTMSTASMYTFFDKEAEAPGHKKVQFNEHIEVRTFSK